ncbi:MAG TPA: CopG family transcriptional regulator [Candidatus Omnitrophica bacterium]|nr:CopG family transcriptional regulator [Candidatus Omnitrophota bacterium]
MAIRTTIYLDPSLHRALKLKSFETSRSLSDLIQDAVKEAMREDEVDLKAVRDRAAEPEVSYESVIKNLKKDGKI